MAIYINTRTRATIDSPTKISGGNWVLKEELKEKVKEQKAEEKVKAQQAEEKEEEPKEEPKKEPEEDKNELTKKDIMQELEAFGIKYNPKATKAELLELLKGKE